LITSSKLAFPHIRVARAHACRRSLEPFGLLYRFYRDFLLLATAVANAPFLDIPKPFNALAIGIRAEGFKNDQLATAIFTSWRHFISSPLHHLKSRNQISGRTYKEYGDARATKKEGIVRDSGDISTFRRYVFSFTDLTAKNKCVRAHQID
jgi:hypothetical protein